MKVQAVYLQTGQSKCIVVGKPYGAYAGNTPDCFVGSYCIDAQPVAGGRVERDAATACIQDKVQGVGQAVEFRLQHHHATTKLFERKAGKQLGG